MDAAITMPSTLSGISVAPRLAMLEREFAHMAEAHDSRDRRKQHDTDHGYKADKVDRGTDGVSLVRHRRSPASQQERPAEDEGMCVWFVFPLEHGACCERGRWPTANGSHQR